jgi:hypothetical protein
MWLYMIAAVLLVVGLVGGVFTGGIFTIVVLPLGVIVLIAAFVFAMWSRTAVDETGGEKSMAAGEPRPLPHTNRAQPGSSGTTSPDELVDARRQAQ